jgi:hypothetical protein
MNRHPSRKTRLRPGYLFLAMVLATAALWNGLIPLRYLPYATLKLSEPDSWFLDFRLAALKRDPEQCKTVLTGPLIYAHAVPDAPYENGCGWTNAVAFSHAGRARVSVDKITCDMAAAFTMWMAHEVQPAAAQFLKSDVKSVQHMGVYACRNIVGRNIVGRNILGSKAFTAFRSQHARANAIDVASFTLTDGRTISVAKSWQGDSSEAKFLHAIHDRACHYFRVALGPDYNAAHSNHFHLDRGAYMTCR